MKIREKFCAWLFEVSKAPYRLIFKQNKRAWSEDKSSLLDYEPNTLGYHLGCFLKENDFELIQKLESHDAYHVICGMNTTVKDEIGMQFLLMGNGKRSVYQKFTIVLGSLLLPEYLMYFKSCYKKGQNMNPVHHLNIYVELKNDLEQIKQSLIRSENTLGIKTISLKN